MADYEDNDDLTPELYAKREKERNDSVIQAHLARSRHESGHSASVAPVLAKVPRAPEKEEADFVALDVAPKKAGRPKKSEVETSGEDLVE